MSEEILSIMGSAHANNFVKDKVEKCFSNHLIVVFFRVFLIYNIIIRNFQKKK